MDPVSSLLHRTRTESSNFIGWRRQKYTVQGYNNRLVHILGTDVCLYGDGMFRVAPHFETRGIEEIFRHNVFKMLLSKGIITQDLVNMRFDMLTALS
jgi:hypothetical protein